MVGAILEGRVGRRQEGLVRDGGDGRGAVLDREGGDGGCIGGSEDAGESPPRDGGGIKGVIFARMGVAKGQLGVLAGDGVAHGE